LHFQLHDGWLKDSRDYQKILLNPAIDRLKVAQKRMFVERQ